MTNKKSEVRGILTDLEHEYLANSNREIDHKKDFNIRRKTLKAFSDLIFILNRCSNRQRAKIIQELQSYIDPKLQEELIKQEETYGTAVLPLYFSLLQQVGIDDPVKNLISEFLSISLETTITQAEDMWNRHLKDLERRESHYFHRAQITNQQFRGWVNQHQPINYDPVTKEFYLHYYLKATYFDPLINGLEKHKIQLNL